MSETQSTNALGQAREIAEQGVCLAALDAAQRHKGEWLAEIHWFDSREIENPYYREVFEAALKLHGEGAPVDAAEVAVVLNAHGRHRDHADIVAVSKRLGDVMEQASHQGGNVIHYARQVHDHFRRRAASEDIGAVAVEMEGAPQPDVVLDELPAITSKYAPAPERRVSDYRQAFQDVISQVCGASQPESVPYGVKVMDKALGGMRPGELIVIAAPTSGGKSILLSQTGFLAAEQFRKHVLFFSLEFTFNEILQRWGSFCSGVPLNSEGRAANDQAAAKYTDGFNRAQMLIDEDKRLLHVYCGVSGPDEIAKEVAKMHACVDIGLIVVDYLQVAAPRGTKSTTREQQVGGVAQKLKELAVAVGAPVLTASQLNRQGDVRESDEIKNAASALIMLKPADKSSSTVDVELDVQKNRRGPRPLIHAVIDRPIYRIRDKDEWDASNPRGEFIPDVQESDLEDFVNQGRRTTPGCDEFEG